MKKRVFISGVTGTMGSATLKQLASHLDKLELVTLVRNSRTNRKLMKDYKDDITIIWGDLTNYEDVKESLVGVDYILHVAALVSPKADKYPKLAHKINVGSIENILKAIKELNILEVKLVNIATVAETGSRLPPLHWGRVGDPLKPSVFDYYATSKIEAERLVIESGLKYWVSLRQTGILHYGLLNIMEGIMFHQPLNNVLEWITDIDSGRLLTNLCLKDLSDDFYRKVYNIGGGKTCRLNNYDFMTKMLSVVNVKDIEEVFEPNWFATRNFHGQYYLDSDVLNDVLDFRRESIDDFIKRLKLNIKPTTSILKIIPKPIIKKYIMKQICKSESGPLAWIKNNETAKINAYFGSLKEYNKIPTWKDLDILTTSDEVIILNHGYDENKNLEDLSLEDLKQAAIFRGGMFLEKEYKFDQFYKPLKWQCGFGHNFNASPNLVLKTGHYCPQCQSQSSNFVEIAKINPFFAQVWIN